MVVGTGKYGIMQIPEETSDRIISCGIELIAEPTDKACSVFNELRKTKKVIACLHLTC
ncbi:MAG: MTH938/NDUFAF3 family protein [Candidatus Eremiobacterota bacterium]